MFSQFSSENSLLHYACPCATPNCVLCEKLSGLGFLSHFFYFEVVTILKEPWELKDCVEGNMRWMHVCLMCLMWFIVCEALSLEMKVGLMFEVVVCFVALNV